jgi:hypothetical protein
LFSAVILYIGQNRKDIFQDSKFLGRWSHFSGGRLVVEDGVLILILLVD